MDVIVKSYLEFVHVIHDIIVKGVDLLEERTNGEKACDDDDAAGAGCEGNEELGTHFAVVLPASSKVFIRRK